ncbi:hypothetical protein [Peribacillus sp. NPDC097895]|uniref:hypothetical protein n=1 Tax=Peribacillus sp. NPDC097895 TaxID=3390619 RepID=UPI003CFE5FBF
MGTIIDYFINDFLKVIGGLSFFGLLGVGIVFISRLMAKQVFDKRMADYQGGIAKELEKIKL